MTDFELKKVCSFCHEVGIPHFGSKPFRRCAKCKLAYYCTEDCQRKDWKANHKQIHASHKLDKQTEACSDPDSLEMTQVVGFPFRAEHHSVLESIRSLLVLSTNLCSKSVFTMDESFNFDLQWMNTNLQKIARSGGGWRKMSNSLSTLEVLYHYPLNSIFRFGSGLFAWWESYIVSFGRVKRAVDFLASLADSGTPHSGNFAAVVVTLVLPEEVLDKRDNNMLVVKFAQARRVGSKEEINCFNCHHEITGKLRPAADPKVVANYHDAALLYPLQRHVYLKKNNKALRPDEVLSQMLALGESVPVFCNYVCDMTVRLEEADKVVDKPTFHVKPGPGCKDILETMCSKTVEGMNNNKEDLLIMMMGNLMGNQGFDGIQYKHSKRDEHFMTEFMNLKKRVDNLVESNLDENMIKLWSDTIFDIHSLIQQVKKYRVSRIKTVLDEYLGRAYFNRGKIHHGNKHFLRAVKDFQRVWSLFQLKDQTRNRPPYKITCLPGLVSEGLEAKCRLAEIYERLGNMKTALSEVSECAVCLEVVTSHLKDVDKFKKVDARITAVYKMLHEMPLVVNVESLAKRKSDKALSYFGCDWQPVSVAKVFDKKHKASVFEETACHSATYLDNKVYILGGTSLHDDRLNTYRPRNLFWALDLESLKMVQLEAPKKVVCRNSHSCVAYNGCLYVYGGDHAKSLNMTVEDHKTTWKYCIATKKWTPLRTTGDSPLTTGHGACVLNGKMYIFGGQPVNVLPPKCERKRGMCLGCVLSSDTDLNDLHVLDLDTLQWNKLSGTGSVNPKFLGVNDIPEGRHYPIMWGDEASRRIFILSGGGNRAKVPHQCDTNHDVYETGNFHFDDFWQFSLHDEEWTKLKLLGNIPVARGETQAAAVKGGAVIFGGYTVQAKALVSNRYFQESQYLQDCFEFRYDKMAFRQIFTEQQPNPRAMFGLVADPTRREKVYLVGGRGNTCGLSSENKSKGKKTKKSNEKLPKGIFLTEGIIYGDIWQLDLTAGEAPGVNIQEAKDEMFCKMCGASSSETRLYQCEGCKDPGLRYCSRPCIVQDWPNHKKNCLDVKGSKEKQQSGEKKKSQYTEEEVE